MTDSLHHEPGLWWVPRTRVTTNEAKFCGDVGVKSQEGERKGIRRSGIDGLSNCLKVDTGLGAQS